MEIILNENQYKSLLIESIENKIESESKEQKKFIGNIVKNVKSDFNLDLRFLLTWSTTIGGLMNPVYHLIKDLNPQISDSDLSLIAVGVILTFYYNNKELLGKVLDLLREKNLVDVFDQMLSKTYDLKHAFEDFISSLGVTISDLTNILAFTFLLNILGFIRTAAEQGIGEDDFILIAKGLVLYFATNTTKNITFKIVKKIFERFKGKN
jgi:hypothetical protein